MTAPRLTGLAPTLTFGENLVNAAPQVLDNDVVFTGGDDDFDGGILSITGLLAEDTISVRDQGTGAGEIGLTGSTLTYEGVTIGTVTGGAGAPFLITFNADATTVAIDALIQNLTYANSSDTPTPDRDLVLNIVDATGRDTNPATFTTLTGASNPLDGIAGGSMTFTDLDGDGDLDMVAGTYGGALRVYDNDDGGTGFSELTGAANVFDGIDAGQVINPTFADLDGDGDLDMVVGGQDGTLSVYDRDDVRFGFTALTGAANPFDGVDVGSNSSPVAVDLDGDGDDDLVVGRLDGTFDVFDNNDADGGFTQLTGAASPFDGLSVGVYSAPSFVDLDGDGDLDMVAGSYFGNLRSFENTGSGFVELTSANNPFNGMTFAQGNRPVFVDLDEDGDMDMVVGGYGGTLTVLDNVTPDGTVISVTVTAESDAPTLQNFSSSVTFDENDVNAAPQILDIHVTFDDPNGDLDGGNLTLSGQLAEDVTSIRNVGTGAGEIGLSGTDVTYGGVVIGTLSGGEGTTMIVTFNAATTSESVDALIEHITYANASGGPTFTRDLLLNVTDGAGQNLGTVPGLQDFTLLGGAANPLNGLNVGTRSAPAFFDADGDGDLDFVSGNYAGTIRYFENNDADDGFTERTGAANPFDGYLGSTSSRPTFADLDGDGDLDVVIGNSGGLVVLDNNDGDNGFTQLVGAASPLNGLSLNDFFHAPVFADIDGDGDDDLITGNILGQFQVFDNNDADFGFTALTGVANPFDGLDIGAYAAPTFADLDNDGDMDMVTGTSLGQLRTFLNTAGTFTELTGAANPFAGIDVGDNASPTFNDLDGDGDLDLVIGNSGGSFTTVENTSPIGQFITVNVNAQVDPMLLSGVAPVVTLAENDVNGAPQLIDADVTFVGGDDDFDGGVLTLTGILAGDTISVRNEGTGAGQIGLSGGDITFGGVTVGTFAGGAGTDLIVTFNADATAAAIDALIQNLTYSNASNSPIATRDLLLNVVNASDVQVNQPLTPAFTQLTGTDNPFDGLNNIFRSNPTFVDLDGDGDMDMVSGDAGGNILLFDNNDADDGFTEMTGAANPLDFITGDFTSAPVFFDADEDGDLDLIVGISTGLFRLYDNNDADDGFTQLTGAANPLNNLNTGSGASPVFVDIDDDGDLDIVAGRAAGTLGGVEVYLNNNGDLGFTLMSGTSNIFDNLSPSGLPTPSFADLDGDGDQDMVLGLSDGTFRVFDNNDSDLLFTELTGAANPFNGVDVGDGATPTFVDLDDDGDLDMVVGNFAGDFAVFENTTPRGIGITINVTPQDDVTSLTGLISSVTYDESTTMDLDLSATALVDLDNNAAFALTLTAGTGVLAAVAGAGVAVSGSGTSVLVLTGLASDIDAFLNDAMAIQYTGADQVFGLGADTITLSADDGGIVTALGGVIVNLNDVINTITGDENDNNLFGDLGRDIITGLAGDDQLVGGGSSDTLYGGAGNDFVVGGGELFGGDGSDLIILNNGSGTAYGGIGNDTVLGNDNDDDILFGDAGDDTVDGGAGMDSLYGGDGADTLLGGDGTDTIEGGGGNDTIAGGNGVDVVFGGDGDDVFISNNEGLFEAAMPGDPYFDSLLYGDTISGGAGSDTIDFSETELFSFLTNPGSPIDYDILHVLDVDRGISIDEGLTFVGDWSSIENLVAIETHATNLIGNSAQNTLTGSNFNDRISAEGGNDVLFGGLGHDLLLGGANADSLYGGAGCDNLRGGNGFDRVFGGADADVLSGFDGNDSLFGGDGNDEILGEAGSDLIDGGLGDDVMNGGNGNDAFFGGDGGDFMIGGRGADYMWGDGGNDFMTAQVGSDYVYGGDGNDVIEGGGGNDRIEGGNDNDYLNGGLGSDVVYGGNGEDTLDGNAGTDILYGGFGNDIMRGEGGNDELFGGFGDDTLFGGAGEDRLNGGAGINTLTGGTGPDTFEFRFENAQDTITDWTNNVDIIDLEQFFATSADVIAAMVQNGANVDIAFSGSGFSNTITIENATIGQFDASDFTF